MRNNKFFLILFFIIALISTASANNIKDTETGDLTPESVDTQIKDNKVVFNTSYMNQSLTPRQIYVPNKINNTISDFSWSYTDWDTNESVSSYTIQYKTVHEDNSYDGRAEQLKRVLGNDADAESELPQNQFISSNSSYSTKTQQGTIGTVFNNKVRDNDIWWDIQVESLNEHLIINYDLVYNNTVNRSEVIWESRDVYSGEETDKFPIYDSYTNSFEYDGKNKQILSNIPDNRYDEPHNVIALTAAPDEYNHSDFTATNNIEIKELDNSSDYYDEAERQILENGMSKDLLIEEGNISEYEFKAYNLTLPKNSRPRLNFEVITGKNKTVGNLKMYIIGSIGGTTTYESESAGSSFLKDFESGFEGYSITSTAYSNCNLNRVNDGEIGNGYYLEFGGTNYNCKASHPALSQGYNSLSFDYRHQDASRESYDLGIDYNNIQIMNDAGDVVVHLRFKDQEENIQYYDGSNWHKIRNFKSSGTDNYHFDVKTYPESGVFDVSIDGETFSGLTMRNSDDIHKLTMNPRYGGGSGTTSWHWWDNVEFSNEYEPPQIKDISTTEFNWTTGTVQDIDVDIGKGDNPVNYVEYKVNMSDINNNHKVITDWTNLTQSSGVWTVDNGFKVNQTGNWTLQVKATGSEGGYNKSIITQEVTYKSPKVNLLSPENITETSSPLKAEFKPVCDSELSCESASLLINKTGNKSKKYITETENNWNEGNYGENITINDNNELVLSDNQIAIGQAGYQEGLSNTEWLDVGLDSSIYGSTPYVFALTTTTNGGQDPSLSKVRSVTQSGFQTQHCEYDSWGCDSHADETNSWIAIDPDKTDNIEGMETGDLSLGAASQTVSFSNSFSSKPIVLAQIQTNNGADATQIEITDVRTGGFDINVCEQSGTDSCASSLSNENVAWWAVNPNTASKHGIFDWGTFNTGSSGWETISFSQSYSSKPSVIMTEQNDGGGQDLAVHEGNNPSASNVDLRFCEAEGSDNCDGHNSAEQAWLSVSTGKINAGSGYKESGNYTSKTFGDRKSSYWNESNIIKNIRTGTSIEVDYGTNKSGVWKYYDTIDDLPKTKYVKFNATLSTSDTSTTPQLDSVELNKYYEREVFEPVKAINNIENGTKSTIEYNFKTITEPTAKDSVDSSSTYTDYYDDFNDGTDENWQYQAGNCARSTGLVEASGDNFIRFCSDGSDAWGHFNYDIGTNQRIVADYRGWNDDNGYDYIQARDLNGNTLIDLNVDNAQTRANSNYSTYIDSGSIKIKDIETGNVLKSSSVGDINGFQTYYGVYATANTGWANPITGQIYSVKVKSKSSPPEIVSINTTPKSWEFDSSVDIEAKINNQTTVNDAKIDVWRGNKKIASEQSLNYDGNNVWSITNLFTPDNNGNYTIGINATNSDGSWSQTNKSYNFYSHDLPKEFKWDVRVEQSDGQTDTADDYKVVTVLNESASIVKIQDNQIAPRGAMWIEEADFRWTNGTKEGYIDNSTIVTEPSPAPKGAIWVEKERFHYITELGRERAYNGTVVNQNSPAPKGAIWIESDGFHYIDEYGAERAATY